MTTLPWGARLAARVNVRFVKRQLIATIVVLLLAGLVGSGATALASPSACGGATAGTVDAIAITVAHEIYSNT